MLVGTQTAQGKENVQFNAHRNIVQIHAHILPLGKHTCKIPAHTQAMFDHIVSTGCMLYYSANHSFGKA